MNENILAFPSGELSPPALLALVSKWDIKDLLIIGRTGDGFIHMTGTSNDLRDASWLLELGRHHLMHDLL